MSAIYCEICKKRMITADILRRHMIKSHAVEEVLTPVIPIVSEPVQVAEPVEVPIIDSQKVTLRFSKSVEITINGVQYFGKIVEAPNMEIAAEIVRIAREAYGREVLE